MATKTRRRLDTQLKSLFGFKTIPFTKNLDPGRLFETESFHKALDHLRYLTDRRGTGAIFGAPGTGKSTLLNSFLESLGKTTHAVCYVTHTTCAALDLYREIARGFQLEPRFRKADVLRDIKERVQKLSRNQGLSAVLVIDEAHLLPRSFLDELRILTSYDRDGRDDLTLILAGHPQLESNLRLAVNEALAQRIVVRVRLRSLYPEEVESYLGLRSSSSPTPRRLSPPAQGEYCGSSIASPSKAS